MRTKRVVLTIEMDTDFTLKELKAYAKSDWCDSSVKLIQVQANVIRPTKPTKKRDGRQFSADFKRSRSPHTVTPPRKRNSYPTKKRAAKRGKAGK